MGEEKAGVRGSTVCLPLAQGLLHWSQRHLDVFLFFTLFFLEGVFSFFGELHTGMLSLLWSAAPLLPGLWWPHPAEWSHWLNCRKTNQRSGELIRSISSRASGRWTTILAWLALLPLGAMQGSYWVDSKLIALRPSYYEHIKGRPPG